MKADQPVKLIKCNISNTGGSLHLKEVVISKVNFDLL